MTKPDGEIAFDFETRSYADLKKVGSWAYSEDPTTDAICACYGIDDGPIQDWWFEDEDMPDDLRHAIKIGYTVEAHSVAFERGIWQNVMVPKYGWILPKDEQWRDTMAVAAYYALPLSLDRLAAALGFPAKDRAGVRLISKYSKLHLKTAKTIIPPEDKKPWLKYCGQDVLLEQGVSDEMGDLPDRELAVFMLDQKINMRGIHLDLEGIEAASSIVDQRHEELAKEFREITKLNPTQNAKLIDWFGDQGLELDNMQKDYLQELMDDGFVPSGSIRRALEIRLAINKASTKKLDAMARQRGRDGRARFQSRYHGAQTGRWTGSGFQPLNLVRGFEGVSPDQLVRDIMHRDASWLDMLYGDAMDAVSKASRHWISAQCGNKIIAGDYVSVEAVILACLAGEEWKIRAFRDRVKIYEHMADKIYDFPPGTVTKKTHPTERQDGKTCLGASTQVLTNTGWKSIVTIKDKDLLWDGISWVKHEGLVAQGEKEVMNFLGVEATPDHKILAGENWIEIRKAISKEDMKRQALETGSENLPWFRINGDLKVGYSLSGLNAIAVRANIWFQRVIYAEVKLRVALIAQEIKPQNGERIFLDMLTYAQTTNIDVGYSTAYPLALLGAAQTGTRTTERGVYGSGLSGGKAPKAEESFCRTSYLSKDGINQIWRSTVSTLIKAMSRGICALSPENKTLKTKDKSVKCKKQSMNLKPVYDLVNAGLRNRFTILTKGGPIIVHNCELAFGYQGALGAWLKFDSSGRHTDERIVEICKAWRAEHPAIVNFWHGLQKAAISATREGIKTQCGQIGFEIVDEWLTMILPSGKRIWYRDPQVRAVRPHWCKPKEYDECASGECSHSPVPQLSYMAQKTGQWKRVSTYGGKLAENACQATSREILVSAMPRVEDAGYGIILNVYDELVCEVPEDFGSLEEFEELMAGPLPDWAVDEWGNPWPIRVEAWEGKRYKK